MGYNIAVLIVLLCLSFFFSCAETSLFSLSKIRIKRLKNDNVKNFKLVEALLNNPTKLIITILTGNMFANVAASSIAASLIVKRWGHASVGISIVLMTAVIVIFCEILPKIIAIRHSESIAPKLSPLLNVFSKAIFPLRWGLNKLAEAVLSIIERIVGKSESAITKDELKSAVHIGYSREGILNKKEAEMIRDVLKLSDKKVEDIMTADRDTVLFPITMPFGDACSAMREAELLRVPVYGKNHQDIVGILYAKDILKKGAENGLNENIAGVVLREPLYVLKDMPLSKLLHRFREHKTHFALVRNSSGRVIGSVTLEDLLGEIVGKIQDKEAVITKIKNKYEFLKRVS
jgi:putative hemolysin